MRFRESNRTHDAYTVSKRFVHDHCERRRYQEQPSCKPTRSLRTTYQARVWLGDRNGPDRRKAAESSLAGQVTSVLGAVRRGPSRTSEPTNTYGPNPSTRCTWTREYCRLACAGRLLLLVEVEPVDAPWLLSTGGRQTGSVSSRHSSTLRWSSPVAAERAVPCSSAQPRSRRGSPDSERRFRCSFDSSGGSDNPAAMLDVIGH